MRQVELQKQEKYLPSYWHLPLFRRSGIALSGIASQRSMIATAWSVSEVGPALSLRELTTAGAVHPR
jgi:hypothetical protein